MKDLPGGGYIGDVHLFDAATEDMVTVPDKIIPQKLLKGEGLEASHGWGFSCDSCDRSVCMDDLFNPLASKSNPTVIHLPPLTVLDSCQT